MTFQEAVNIGLKNNIDLKQQQNQQFANQAAKTAEIASIAPTISARAQASRTRGNSFNQNEGQVVNGTFDQISSSINANMTLFNSFSRLNSIRRADYRLTAQQHRVQRTTQDIISLVSNQYLTVLVDKEILSIAEKTLESQLQQLEQIKEQVALGTVAEVDQISQIATVKNQEYTVLQAENRLRNDKVTLAQTLQIDPTIDFEVEEPDWNLNSVNFDDIELESLYNTALEKRADLKLFENLEGSAKMDLAISKADFYPTLSGSFFNGTQFNSLKDQPEDRGFNDQFFTDNTFRGFAMTLNVPIFSGMRNRSAFVQAKVAHQNAILDKQNTELNVKSEVLRAYLNFKDAVLSYQRATVGLESSKLAYELQKESYSLGSANLVQYTIANIEYVNAQANLSQARYTLIFQKILLDYAVGVITPEDIP
ncbi:MAG: TolC family protein [Bacteroidota bacterium]